jgi:hypothetical protein
MRTPHRSRAAPQPVTARLELSGVGVGAASVEAGEDVESVADGFPELVPDGEQLEVAVTVGVAVAVAVVVGVAVAVLVDVVVGVVVAVAVPVGVVVGVVVAVDVEVAVAVLVAVDVEVAVAVLVAVDVEVPVAVVVGVAVAVLLAVADFELVGVPDGEQVGSACDTEFFLAVADGDEPVVFTSIELGTGVSVPVGSSEVGFGEAVPVGKLNGAGVDAGQVLASSRYWTCGWPSSVLTSADAAVSFAPGQVAT